MEKKNFIEIDGSILEGGGQIIRISIPCSIILQYGKIVIKNIRGNRPKPGLKRQHLSGVQLVNTICEGTLKGDKLDSSRLELIPSKIQGGSFKCDVKTAGSVTLLTQIAIPVIIFSPSPIDLELSGGTNVPLSPQIDEIIYCLVPYLSAFGIDIEVVLKRRGFYPKGNGIVEVHSQPIPKGGCLKAINFTEFGELSKFTGVVYSTPTIPQHVNKRIKEQAEKLLVEKFGKKIPIKIDQRYEGKQSSFGQGTGIALFAHSNTGCILGSSALGERKVSSEEVARRAFQPLVEDIESNACVDRHTQDQLIIFMALAEGISKFRTCELSLHTQTAIHFVTELTGAKFLTSKDGSSWIIECEGIGHKNGLSMKDREELETNQK
ncbi:RNA 3'-terminal phosphate cyclase [Anaeramoeba ignava]|uniref:RNA 3'-terminal-phosphate cyclase (ATP) n=1 Tax=Anaeramoeba ignava TaxID=1746090 RepID=A0A9Q0LYB2_ANAIG|nr:RNA 3'-terminal phosphate cyclase [Anaeramoeba ignava]